MNHCSVFLNTQIENSGKLAQLGDLGLAPFRYLFNGQTIRIEHVGQVIKIHRSKTNLDLPSSSKKIKTGFATLLLIPGLTLTVFKGLAYLFASVRDNHYLTKEWLTKKIVISGYFCTGKTSVMKRLEEEFNLHKPKDYTTRAMRKGESEGNPYTFISEETYNKLKSENKLFDPISHAGNYYGLDKEQLYSGKAFVMDILPDSWETFRDVPGVIGIYLIPPSKEVLKDRAIKRGDLPKSIEQRLQAIKEQDAKEYHYAIPPQNSLEDLYSQVKEIITGLS